MCGITGMVGHVDRERLVAMRQHHFFTSDLSVNEFLLVKEVGFQPLGQRT